MRNLLFYFLVTVLFGKSYLSAQNPFLIPPSVKKIDYANREVTFSEVTLNGEQTTYLAVAPGETVNVKVRISSERNGNYCPGCIVQIYWGIRDYTSVCAKSFGGYRMKKKKSKHTFTAPMTPGIYYITMGGSLEYSCQNTLQRPRCEAENAIAVIKVGTPDVEQKISFTSTARDTTNYLKTAVKKPGAYGPLTTLRWFFNAEPLPYVDQQEIPLNEFGTYTATWSNCLTQVSDSVRYSENEVLEFPARVAETTSVTDAVDTIKETTATDSTDIATLIKTSDKFVLKNLLFDLNSANIRPKGKKVLEQLAQIMKSNPNMEILLEGHTAIGNARKNIVLSEKRVKSTKKYLVERGVEKNNIQTKGWGQQKPLVITREIEKGEINRRVEIQILAR